MQLPAWQWWQTGEKRESEVKRERERERLDVWQAYSKGGGLLCGSVLLGIMGEASLPFRKRQKTGGWNSRKYKPVHAFMWWPQFWWTWKREDWTSVLLCLTVLRCSPLIELQGAKLHHHHPACRERGVLWRSCSFHWLASSAVSAMIGSVFTFDLSCPLAFVLFHWHEHQIRYNMRV